MQQQPLPML